MRRLELEIEQLDGPTCGPLVTFTLYVDGKAATGPSALNGSLESCCEHDPGILGQTYRAWLKLKEIGLKDALKPHGGA